MQPLTDRERQTIIHHKLSKEKDADIAKWLRISISSITRIWHLYKTEGHWKPKPQNSGRKPKVSKEQMEVVFTRVKEQPDITLWMLIDKYELNISESALSKRFSVRGLTLKKRRPMLLSKKDQM